MTTEKEILSDITVHMKYARYQEELQRRETWTEIVKRNMDMHIKKYPDLEEEIVNVYDNFVITKKVLPSMRSMQFGGKPIEISPNRVYNWAYLPIDSIVSFAESMFLLLGGTGVGYSVQRHHIEELPEIVQPNPNRTRRYLIADSIEGWADSVKVLLECYTGVRSSSPVFDYSDIRPKGSLLRTSGGKAPGFQPLRECLVKIEGILQNIPIGEKLKSIQVHDIMCHLADAVLAGGIRRAAMISLFSADDTDMIACKSGNWWENNAQRGRANNSAVILRHRVTKEFFMELWERIQHSGSGEPAIYFSNEKDSLLGVSMTGIASGVVEKLDLEMAAFAAKMENKRVASIIGISEASRVTCVKPAGTTSLVLGTSSGIHAWHDKYYIRRVRVGKNEAIYSYLAVHHPELVEDEYFNPTEQAVISIPQKAPTDATIRTENVFDLFGCICEPDI